MSADFILIKAFVRQALRTSDGKAVASLEIAIQSLEEIQEGHFTQNINAEGDGTILIASTVSGKTYNFKESAGLTSERILSLTEKAIEYLESCNSVADAKTYLRPAKSYTPDFTNLQR